MHQGGGHQERLGELRLNDLGRTPLRRAALELVGVTGGVGLDRHRRDILGPLDLQRARAASAASIAACSGRPQG